MAPKPTTNLALESGAAEDASVVDALPYIDGITADERYQADELIKEEVCDPPAPVWQFRLSRALLNLGARIPAEAQQQKAL